jgi:molybdate transport system substrate-binding protein
MSPWSILLRVLALPLLLLLPGARAHELTLLAASSLADALTEAAPAFTNASGHRLRLGFAASGTLARQIEQGAPADLFVSADQLRVDQLERAGLLLPGTRRPLLANLLVVAVPSDFAADLASPADLRSTSFRRIALGDPATVPAGTYARSLLDKLGLWSELQPRLLPVTSVRAALATLEAGHADAAFVYRTDALSTPRVRIALELPPPEGPAIVARYLRSPRLPTRTPPLNSRPSPPSPLVSPRGPALHHPLHPRHRHREHPLHPPPRTRPRLAASPAQLAG